MQAIFRGGNPNFVPYTASGAVSAGDVIVEGANCFIAHWDIPASTLGTVAAGGGDYDFLATSGDVIAMGDELYWNDSSNVAEEATTSNTKLGKCLVAKGSGETTIRATHRA